MCTRCVNYCIIVAIVKWLLDVDPCIIASHLQIFTFFFNSGTSVFSRDDFENTHIFNACHTPLKIQDISIINTSSATPNLRGEYTCRCIDWKIRSWLVLTVNKLLKIETLVDSSFWRVCNRCACVSSFLSDWMTLLKAHISNP